MKMHIMKNQKQRIFLMLSFVLFFAIGECGWAGLNQLPQQDTKDNEKLLLALPFFSVNRGTTSSVAPTTTSSVAPTIISVLPAQNAIDVSISSSIIISFSKPMTPTSIDSTTITLLQGTTTVLSQISMLNSEVAVIVPSGNLSTYTSYTVTITTDVKCIEGIPLATHYAWNFTTGADSLPLSVVSVSPANTTLNVSPTAGILVTFQKAVDSATLISANITITANGSLFPMVLTITPVGTSAVLISSTTPLANFTLHTLQLTSGIKDTSGNALTGNPYTSVFTTSSESGVDGGSVTTISGPLSVASGTAEGTALNPFLARYNLPRFLAWANIAGTEKLFITNMSGNNLRILILSGATAGLTTSLAGLNSPRGVIINHANTELFITNTTGQNIKKVTLPSTLVAAALAGSGVAGYVNATGVAARFNNPEGIAIDSEGILFVTDQTNHVIRKITSAGVVTTLAGAYPTVISGSIDATGTSARFNAPRGIAIDASNNIYVTDSNNHTIRKITQSGIVTTIAGSALNPGYENSSGVAARFNTPQGIVFVPAQAPNIGGMLLITDTLNHAIRMLDPNTGMVTTYAGPLSATTGGVPLAGYVNSTRFASRFNYPVGITVNPSSGVVYITDTNNYAIKKITY